MKTRYCLWTCLAFIVLGMGIFVIPTSAAHVNQSLPAPSSTGNSYLALSWRNGIWGTGIGASGLTAFDIDGDGQTEIVSSGEYGTGPGTPYGGGRFWYILSYSSQYATYQQEWLSKEYLNNYIYRIVIGDPTGSGLYFIYVALSDNTVEVYDAQSRQMIATFVSPYKIWAMAMSDVDSDGVQEIITSSSNGLAVLDALTYQLEWQSNAYGSRDVAVANVDTDPNLEIVTINRVIDGTTHTVEWDFISTFGIHIQLADIDADQIAEIIASMDWYYIYAYDADTQTTKWNISARYDISALYVGDVDNDSVQEVVYGDAQGGGAIHAYDSITLNQEWFINNPDHGVTNITFADPDADGMTEVLWGSGWTSSGPDYLNIGDMTIQAIEWRSLDVVGPLSALETGDVDNDGVNEIVMVSYSSNSNYSSGIIFIYDAVTYELEWQSDPLLHGRALDGTDALELADVDLDGVQEIIIGTSDLADGVILAFDGITHELDWQTNFFEGTSFSGLAIADTDNDGILEVVGGQERETTGAEGVYVRIFDGRNGIEEWHTPDLGYWVGVYDIAVIDSNNDGNPEILFSIPGHDAYVYDGVTHIQDWVSNIPSPHGVYITDVDEDDQLELLLGTFYGQLYAFDGRSFGLEWTLPVSGAIITAIRMADFEADNSKELVVCDSNNLFVYDANTRVLIWQSDALGKKSCSYGHMSIDDIDNNGLLEVVFGNSYAIHVFTFDNLPFFRRKEVSRILTIPGETLTYSLYIQNNGDAALPAIITDTLPNNSEYIPDSIQVSSGEWEMSGDDIQWSVNLTSSIPATLTFGVTVAVTTTDNSIISNSAYFTAAGYSQSYSVSTLIDALPPISTITQPVPGELISGDVLTITGYSTDTTSGVESSEVRINNGNWELATGVEDWQYIWTLPMSDSWITIDARASDNIGHVETTGPSVTVFVDNLSPFIETTIPQHESIKVPIYTPLVISFSEPISPETLEVECNPDPGGWSVIVNPDERTYILAHAPFDYEQIYLCSVISAVDRAGHSLVPGSVPNPWAFITSSSPYVPIAEVGMNGPENGMVDQFFTFTATTVPISATLPITYLWETTDHELITHTNGITDTIIIAWDTPGSKQLSVTASNSVSTATISHQLIIDTPYHYYCPYIKMEGINTEPEDQGMISTYEAQLNLIDDGEVKTTRIYDNNPIEMDNRPAHSHWPRDLIATRSFIGSFKALKTLMR